MIIIYSVRGPLGRLPSPQIYDKNSNINSNDNSHKYDNDNNSIGTQYK